MLSVMLSASHLSSSLPVRMLGLVLLARSAFAPRAQADDWPQWRGPQRDGVWRETGIVEKLPAQLPIVWRREIGGGYAGPAVAQGRVFVPDRLLGQGVKNPDDPFQREQIQGGERLFCLDAKTGRELWKHEYPCQYEVMYPSGPRVTPTVDGGKVYHLGAMGDFFCLTADGGKVLWSKQLLKNYGGKINAWGFSSAPLIDGKKVILVAGGRPGAGVIALDKDTGADVWKALDLEDFGYAPPVLIEAGGRRQLIAWTPKAVSSLDPETGAVLWEQPFALESALSIATPIYDAKKRWLFVTAFYNGPLLLELAADAPAARVVWKGKSQSERETDGLHAILCTPVFHDGHIYGVCSYGQLRCLEQATGKRVWETLEATGSGRWWNAFIIQHGERFLVANEQGDLIFAQLEPSGYRELSRTHLIDGVQPIQRRKVVWSHPAFAGRCVFARNDQEILCADLAAK